MSTPTLWFSTRSNGTLHHALAEGTCGLRYAKCSRHAEMIIAEKWQGMESS